MKHLEYFLPRLSVGPAGAAALSRGAGNGIFLQDRSDVAMTVEAHLLFDRRSEILNQMKAISHLAGLRRAFSGSLGVETAAISTDDLNGRTR